MAMDYDKLGTDITEKILEVGKSDKLTAKMVWTAIAKEIVEHIKENAEVNISPVETTVKVTLTAEELALLSAGQTSIELKGTGQGVVIGAIDKEVEQ